MARSITKKAAKPRADGRRDGEVSATEMAKRLEMTPQSLGVWCKRPGAPVRVEGTRVWIMPGPFIRWREKELVAQALKEASPSVSYAEARIRRAVGEARLIEIEVADRLKEIITIEDSAKALGVALDRVTTLVRGLPARLAHLGEVVESAAEDEVELIIAELSEFSDDVLPDQPEADA